MRNLFVPLTFLNGGDDQFTHRYSHRLYRNEAAGTECQHHVFRWYAIAIGAMVDGAIVVVENLHKHIHQHAVSSIQVGSVRQVRAASQRDSASQSGAVSDQPRISIISGPTSTPLTAAKRWELVIKSTTEVGPALFFALLIITVSFIPVFALEAQEGRLFAPLAFTKTYAMAAAAALAITLVPVLAGYFVRGKIRSESENPVNRVLERVYQPLLIRLLNYPLLTLVGHFAYYYLRIGR